MNEPWFWTLSQTISELESGTISEAELNLAYQHRIDELNPKLNCYLQVIPGSQGIPVSIKDIIVTKGITTTAGSKILENFVPPYNATVVERLLNKNMRICAKSNCDEFAMGSSGENSAYGPAKNPWDLTKVPGGSSSGSAVAVTSGLSVFSLGTDTGGSIRQPASLSGVVGLKPSYGRVSRYGAIALASSLDQIGPITKSVTDARLVFSWIAGEDGYDSNCSGEFKLEANQFKNGLKGVKLGVPKEYFGQGLDREVEKVIRQAIAKMQELGANIIEVSLPHTDYAIECYYIILPSEVSSNLARFDALRFGSDRSKFGPEPKRRIMLGTFALSTGYDNDYFIQAAKVRTLIKQDFDAAFTKCDVIVGPVSPTVAWNLGEKVSDPLAMYLSDVYSIPANLAGVCGISVPCGFSQGLPVGLQIIGNRFAENTILDVAEIYEQATAWHKERPKL